MTLTDEQLDAVIHVWLLSAPEPLSIKTLLSLFDEAEAVTELRVKDALARLSGLTHLPYTLVEVASGYRWQTKSDYAPWLSRLFAGKASRYSKATLETLALIAYRQPITRAEIDEIRGVSTSAHIIKSLLEREWICVVGQRDVPGRPSLYATTTQFLDYFQLTRLSDLPALTESTVLPI